MRKEYTLSITKMNWYSVLMIIPITAILLTPFVLIWGFELFWSARKEFFDLFLYVFVFGIVLHEFLHGLTWSFFTKKGFKSIKFGINGITPYSHCKEPLKVKHYKLGGVMPLIIIGIIPAIIGIIIGSGLLLWLGLFFTITAGGDIISLFMLRSFDSNAYVQDHPKEMGFYFDELPGN